MATIPGDNTPGFWRVGRTWSYQRGRIGNTAAIAPDTPETYRDLGKHAEGYFFLEGDWLLTAEAVARPVGAQGESKRPAANNLLGTPFLSALQPA